MHLNEVKWLKFPVGFTTMPEFVGMRGERAMRDRLGCLWFELFDMAGRLDQNGKLIKNGVAMTVEEIARVVSRKPQTVGECLEWYLREGLLTLDGETGAYRIEGWEEVQSTEKMKKLRLARAARTAEHTEDLPVRKDENKKENHKTEENRKEENKKEKNKIEWMKKEETPPTPLEDYEASKERALALMKKREEEKKWRESDPERAAQYQRLMDEYKAAKMR